MEDKLRLSRRPNGIRNKGKFSQLCRNRTNCPLMCWTSNDNPIKDTQEHLMVCNTINTNNVAIDDIKYDDIYGSPNKQKEIVTLYKQLLHERNVRMEALLPVGEQTLDPSTPRCCTSTPSYSCTITCLYRD